MCHSGGTIQSKTSLPEGTEVSSSGICSPNIDRLS
jgi:hypothetical protein